MRTIKYKIAWASFVIITAFMIAVIVKSYHSPFNYYGENYSVSVDSSIKHLFINGQDIRAKYKIFQCEENYNQKWKVETFIRMNKLSNNTIQTYSELYLFNCLKTFIFYPNHFTVNISKCYTKSGFDMNNQIIFDVKSFDNIVITVLYSNVLITFQYPSIGNPTELQFNINNQSDRDIRYHEKGTIESVLFNIEII